MKAGGQEDAIVDINVTPLVDVSLVLLIIFLATSYLIAQQSLKVELPKASKASATEAKTVAVVIRANGEVDLDGAPIGQDDLVRELTARRVARPNLQVLVGADREVAHGRVVDVMDAARSAGIDRVAIAVDRK